MGCFRGRKVLTVNQVNESSTVGSNPTLSSSKYRGVTLGPDKTATGNWYVKMSVQIRPPLQSKNDPKRWEIFIKRVRISRQGITLTLITYLTLNKCTSGRVALGTSLQNCEKTKVYVGSNPTLCSSINIPIAQLVESACFTSRRPGRLTQVRILLGILKERCC